MTAPATEVIFYGLSGLEARDVTVFCVGLNCGSYTVASDGTVRVPFGSDPDGLFTIARIQSVDAESLDWGPLACDIDIFLDPGTTTYTVPCAIGFAYNSDAQMLRPADDAEIKSQRGDGLGKKRMVNEVAALLDATIGISFGTDFTQLTEVVLRESDGTPLDHATMFSGVYADTITDYSATGYDGEICWRISGPYPATVVSVSGYAHVEERG